MKITIATRKSPLALVQAGLVAARLQEKIPDARCELLHVVTTGDRQAEWSLSKEGGKGLFTAELEQALLHEEADIAVHSCKDLPGENTTGLVIAGFLPREDTRDVLVVREGVPNPVTIATGSPRRQLQIAHLFPGAQFIEIRGNVDTRLKKVAGGQADATVLAAAGLKRLGIAAWPGVSFRMLNFDESVPAVGQGAIAVQCRMGQAINYSIALDVPTAHAVILERTFQHLLGGGCQTAFGAHATADRFYFFHEKTGIRSLPLDKTDLTKPRTYATRVLKELGFNV